MSYDFKRELSFWLKDLEISRKELIAILQQSYYDDFKGLDPIALSRWLSGRVVPPLYKQFLIAKSLEQNLTNIISTIDENNLKIPSRHSTVLTNLIKAFDFSLTAMSYTRIPPKLTSEIKSQTYYDHIELFRNFYENVPVLRNFTDELYALKNEVKYKVILLKNGEGNIIGHWSCILNLEKLNNLPSFISIPKNELNRSCLIKLGYAMNSRDFFELVVQAICYYLIKQYKFKDYVYIFVAGYPILEFSKKIFNAKEVKYYPPINSGTKIGIHLVKFDIIRSITNPVLLPKIKEKLNCLKLCEHIDCHRCNLKNFYQE